MIPAVIRAAKLQSAGLAALCLLGLGACGSSSSTSTSQSRPAASRAQLPARKILDEAAAALTRAHSFALHGQLDIEKHPSRVGLEVEEPGTVRVTIERGTSVISVIDLGDANTAYMRANAAFFRLEEAKVPSAAVGLLANRWLKVPAKEVTGGTKLDARSLGRCLAGEPGTLTVDGMGTVDGQAAVIVSDKGDAPGATPAKFYVAATGEPVLLRALATGKQRPGGTRESECSESGDVTTPGDEISLSRYNEPMNITAPVGAVETSQLVKQLAGG